MVIVLLLGYVGCCHAMPNYFIGWLSFFCCSAPRCLNSCINVRCLVLFSALRLVPHTRLMCIVAMPCHVHTCCCLYLQEMAGSLQRFKQEKRSEIDFRIRLRQACINSMHEPPYSPHARATKRKSRSAPNTPTKPSTKTETKTRYSSIL